MIAFNTIILLAVAAIAAVISLTHDASGATGCIAYDNSSKAIMVACNATFSDIINSNVSGFVLHGNTTSKEWTLDADLRVGEGATLSITQNDVSWLKVTGAHGIIVNGRLQMEGVKVTSWDAKTQSVILQEHMGSIKRAFIQLNGSDGGWIRNSDIGYLGEVEPGKRGIDLYGAFPSHGFSIVGSKIHNMFHAIHTVQAYNITIKDSEFYDNIGYTVDPHSGSHDIKIIGNHVHDNKGIGIICSLNCYDIVVEGNRVHDNGKIGIMFSRNTTNSTAMFNTVDSELVGIAISESSQNKVYNNSIVATTSAITLNTQNKSANAVNNILHSNSIRDSFYGIQITQARGNTAINNEFDGVGQEYILSNNSTINIWDPDFMDQELAGGAGNNAFNLTNTSNVTSG
jgi:parallel beta-helix repeat protein